MSQNHAFLFFKHLKLLYFCLYLCGKLRMLMYIHNNDINQILTKYYYQSSQLCYQILVQTNDGISHIIEEHNSYSDYKRAIVLVEEKLKSGTVIEVKQYSSEKSVLSAVA
jgi:hypothetical protein